jgi:glutamate:GABA antiporter
LLFRGSSAETDLLHPASSSATGAESPNRPRRTLGFRDLLFFYVITGISLRWIAAAASAGPSAIVIWIGAWFVFYLPLALCVIELSSRYPDEGGIYVWSKYAFGDFSGFMTAWTYWVSNLPYFPAVLYFAASNSLYMRESWNHLSHNAGFFVVFSLLALALATLLNTFGLNVGTWLHNLGAIAMWTPALIVIAMGAVAWHGFGSATSFTPHALLPSTRLSDLIFWSVLIYAFTGSETASLMGGEIKDPRRNIPRALLIGGATVAFCYILGTIAILVALPAAEGGNLQGLMQAISKTAIRIHFEGVIPVAAFLIALSNVGAASAYLAAGARLPFVAGIDRFLPSAFGRLHSRWKTPWVALLTQFVLGALFVFLAQAGTSIKGAYDVLVSMGVLTYFLPYLYLFAAMIKLQGEPAGREVIRAPGGKPVAIFVAVIGLTITTLTIILSLIPQPDEPNKPLAVLKVAGGCAALLLIGGWLYWAGSRRKILNAGGISVRRP